MRPYLEDVLIRNAKIGGDLKYASNSQAITANFTIPDSSGTVQKIDATSTNRNVTLPTPADGLYKIVINASSGAAVLTVKDVAGPTTIATLSQNSVGLFWCVGTSWYGMAMAEDITGAELETLHGVTAGTVSASKAIVVDSNKHIDTLGIAASGLKIGVSGSETTVTATGTELNTLAGVTAGTAAASKAVVLDSSKGIATITSATITTLTTTTVTAAGAVTSSSPSAGIGYATGAGAAVTQITSRTTGVTINAICGSIQTDVSSLAAAAEAEFTVTNSAVAAADVVVLSLKTESTTGTTFFFVSTTAAGSFKITATNLHASTADTSLSIINFVVIKAVVA